MWSQNLKKLKTDEVIQFLKIVGEWRGTAHLNRLLRINGTGGRLKKNIKRGVWSVLYQKLRVDEKIILVEKKWSVGSGKPKLGHFVGFVKKVAEVKKNIFL